MAGRPIRLALAILFWVLSAAAALAHSPHFSKDEPITLPGGQTGEMRLLRGDGIFFADPAAAVILDQEKRLVAWSRESRLLSLICDHGCRAYDYETDEVLDPDSTAFQTGGPIASGRDGAVELSNFLDPGKDDRGFAARPASTAEWLSAETALAKDRWGDFGFVFILGVAAAALGVVGAGLPKNRSRWSVLAWLVVLLLRLCGIAIILCVPLYSIVARDLTEMTSFGGFCLGVGLFFLIRHLVNRNKSTAAAPAPT